MIVAQITQITHVNDLYQQWAIMGALIAVCAAMFSALWWLLKMKTQETIASSLKIRSGVASLFQQTVLDEAFRIFDLIDGHFATSLSQVDEPIPRPSTFDRLSQDLTRLDPADPNRELYRDLLHAALGGTLVNEVRKLFHVVKANSTASASVVSNPMGLRFSFGGESERALSFIAVTMARVARNEKWFYRSKQSAFNCFLVAGIACFLAAPWIFVDQQWAYWVCVIILGIGSVAIVSGLVSLGVFHKCQSWLEQCAERHNSADDWTKELIQHRT
jgi:hypothetical protein